MFVGKLQVTRTTVSDRRRAGTIGAKQLNTPPYDLYTVHTKNVQDAHIKQTQTVKHTAV